MKTKQTSIEAYNYYLPDERIAKFPLEKRDTSKLLVYKEDKILDSSFGSVSEYLPNNTLLVFNNTRVIRARMHFAKETGAEIEVFCLEPINPHDYTYIFQTNETCEWLCFIGNAKKWKNGKLSKQINIKDKNITLKVEKGQQMQGGAYSVTFEWDDSQITFADIIEASGELPIPPYLNRNTEEADLTTYQTVYSKIKGSVAAPTAGLHFTPELLSELDSKGFKREELTLHVGAGTFKPVQSETIEHHSMHTETIVVNRKSIANIKDNLGNIIAVGTTTVRTLESLYYLGVKISNKAKDLRIEQWMPYEQCGNSSDNPLSPAQSLQTILDYMDEKGIDNITAETQIIIAPGYKFNIINGMITNFHQPKSTLLLLVSALIGDEWKRIYQHALENNYRFLSYGDSSLIMLH